VSRYLASVQEIVRIIWAVMLVDMKTRFGSSILSYLVAIAWPLSHMAFTMVGFLLANKIAAIGDDPAVFAGAGMLPYILCIYPARLSPATLFQNKALLNLQVVKPMHLLLARFTLEALSAIVVCIIFYVTLLMLGVSFMPLDPTMAVGAVLASVYLGVGLGATLCALGAIMGHFVNVFAALVALALYLVSGCLVPYAMMPRVLQVIADYNPIYHCVDWLRASYFLGGEANYSASYVLLCGTFALCIGLAGERLMRGRYL
jgi:capsular polysaccharide transport system permease protein